jgi:hypothetical protein
MSRERTVFVDGIALWAPRMPGWEIAREVLRDERAAVDPPAARPAASLLPPTERRRAPDSVALALEVALRATEAAHADPKTMPSVFASTHGDLAISDYMCETLVATPTLISPTRFHNSVHNAAAGYWTIGTGSHAPYTALTAHRHTFGAGWLEAAAQVACDDARVLLVAFDVESRGPMATVTPSRGLFGVALVLAAQRSADTQCEVRWSVQAGAAEPTPARHAALVEGNALAACLSLFEGFAGGADCRVQQTLAENLTLELDLRMGA